MPLAVYLSGEIHTNWRATIMRMTEEMGLDIDFQFPVLDHGLSNDCGVKLLGSEEKKFCLYCFQQTHRNCLHYRHYKRKKQYNRFYKLSYSYFSNRKIRQAFSGPNISY